MAPSPTDFTTFHFSTKGVPPHRRIPMWHEVFGRSVSRRTLSLRSGGTCHVDMTVQSLARNGGHAGASDGACLQRMFLAGGLSAQRTPELLSDGNDDVVLHVQISGHRMVSQCARETNMGPGDGLLTSNADTSTIVLLEPGRFACIALPRKLMMTLAPGLEDTLVRALPPDAGALRLLPRYLDILDDEDALRTPELRRSIVTHVHDLCALAIGATRDAAEIAAGRGLRAARLRAVKADVMQNLGNGDVSAPVLARRQRVTSRYIHKLFESEGTTLSRFVLGQRLTRVHRMLGDPCYAHRTIGALAFDVGFGDLSTFNREFRRLYGATPSDVRAAARMEPAH
jgi:AraC-like DNA-binding protein